MQNLKAKSMDTWFDIYQDHKWLGSVVKTPQTNTPEAAIDHFISETETETECEHCNGEGQVQNGHCGDGCCSWYDDCDECNNTGIAPKV